MSKKTRRFLKYSIIGVSTFIIDLSLLWFLTDVIHIYYLVSTFIAFMVGVTINYFVSRRMVFNETARNLKTGYLYFLIVVSFGIVFTLGIMYILVNYAHLSIIGSRIVTSGFIGVFNFLINDTFNFKIKP
ncbi:MAG: GtrA family protein [Candidatus Taylorbacteria bacterium]|nr:GtrA family protein [Candidatus Taylorbacteria bacterium]